MILWLTIWALVPSPQFWQYPGCMGPYWNQILLLGGELLFGFGQIPEYPSTLNTAVEAREFRHLQWLSCVKFLIDTCLPDSWLMDIRTSVIIQQHKWKKQEEQSELTPLKFNIEPLKIAIMFWRNYLFQTSILGIHVRFLGCKMVQAPSLGLLDRTSTVSSWSFQSSFRGYSGRFWPSWHVTKHGITSLRCVGKCWRASQFRIKLRVQPPSPRQIFISR